MEPAVIMLILALLFAAGWSWADVDPGLSSFERADHKRIWSRIKHQGTSAVGR